MRPAEGAPLQYEVVMSVEVPFNDSPKRFAGLPPHLWREFGHYSHGSAGTGDGYLEHAWCATLTEPQLDELLDEWSFVEAEENMGMLMGEDIGIIPSVYCVAETVYGHLHFTISGYPEGADLRTWPFGDWEQVRESIRRKCLREAYEPARDSLWRSSDGS